MSQHHRFVPSNSVPLIWGLTLLALVGLFGIAQPVVAVWSEAPSTPLTGSQPTFLNGSSAAQRKTGSLLLGSLGRSSVLCLNADPALSVHAAGNSTKCIDAWADIATISGSYVRRQENVIPGNATDPSTYGLADYGFGAVKAIGTKNQYISTVVKPNPAATSPVKYAVYATDGGSELRYAAQLSGKSVIDNAAHDAKLCLNGECITHWSDVSLFAATAVIRLQTANYLTADNGNASVSGVLWLQRGLTVGRPTSSTPPAYSNSDGQCTDENDETPANSPTDCL